MPLVQLDEGRVDRPGWGSPYGEADAARPRLKVLREARDAIAEGSEIGVSAQRAIEWLRALAESIQQADVPKERAELMHAIYDRVTVAGPEIVGVRLTQAAYAHGLALALPEKVVMARPTRDGRVLTAYRIPIEGRAEWMAVARARSA